MQKKSARTTELEKSYLQKQTDYAARFALILHCLETPEQDEISLSTICKAIDSNKKIDKDTKNELFVNIVLYSFVCLFLYGICTQIYNEKIKYQGYVYAFPDDKAKNYRLVADIEENNIKRIYFYNGGYIDFYTCDYFNSKGETFSCEPTEDERNWDFRYYGEKVKK